jgi:hypothetical protein
MLDVLRFVTVMQASSRDVVACKAKKVFYVVYDDAAEKCGLKRRPGGPSTTCAMTEESHKKTRPV